jgi:hypothetical protein
MRNASGMCDNGKSALPLLRLCLSSIISAGNGGCPVSIVPLLLLLLLLQDHSIRLWNIAAGCCVLLMRGPGAHAGDVFTLVRCCCCCCCCIWTSKVCNAAAADAAAAAFGPASCANSNSYHCKSRHRHW